MELFFYFKIDLKDINSTKIIKKFKKILNCTKQSNCINKYYISLKSTISLHNVACLP